MPETPTFTEHVFRSVRGWLHQLYPQLDILIMLDKGEEDTRPLFRLELASGPKHSNVAPGLGRMDLTIVVRYNATGQWDAQRVVDRLCVAALPPRGRIPLSLYNFVWPARPNLTINEAAGGSLPEELDIAVAVQIDGGLSLPSERLEITLEGGDTVTVHPQGWPKDEAWRLYAGERGALLTLQGAHAAGEPATLTELLEGDLAPTTGQRLPFGGLRVQGTDGAVMEQPDTDSVWDGLVTLRLSCDVPYIQHSGWEG